jgi:ATP-dependent transcriptional regulator
MAISLCIKGREEMTKNIIIKTSVQKRFDSFMVHGRVLFFSAPCGFGKTVLADALLRGRNVLRQSAADPDCAIPPSAQDWDILLIDDLQFMQEEAGQQALCELIRSSPERHFVLLSRGVPPGCLMAFQYTGLMTMLEADDLLFDAGDVRRTIMVLRECFAERGLTRFLPNMDAMLCRIDMHTGDLDAADAWYREKAPREPTHLNVMRRYQYLTQAMVELEDGRPDTVQLTLAPLEPYVQNCARIIDGIHLNVLTAIALYRKKDERWRERLTAALDAAAEYRFIRTVSVYGTAVLPLLEVLDWDGDKAWRKRLMAAVRTQAAFYPHFLEPRLAPGEELTPTERQILHLLCADKSNAEIAQIMDVKLPTVKTHVSHILDKLDVKRRAEAKAAAKKLRLIPDDL